MKKSFALILFTLFTTFLSVKAQSDYITDTKKIEEINSRPLKVVLKKGNSKSTQEYNEKFKEAVLSEWTITDDIKFISHEEYKEQSKNKNSKYAYLKVGKTIKMHSMGSNAGTSSTTVWITYYTLDNKKPVMSTWFEIEKKDDKAKYFTQIQKLNIFTLEMLSTKMNEPSLYDLYKRKDKTALNNYLDEHAKKAKEILKTKTLLIDRDLINKKLDSEIKTYYPFNYKIVSEEEINNAIVSNDSTKAIISKDNITDADTGELILLFSIRRNTSMKTKIAPFGIGLGYRLKENSLINLGSYLN
ncbi:hypothetical protein [Lacinutrix undariae]